ncbi:MAG: ribosome small subunit-dependent GTPase A [Planctomycetales bacterium]|nr:ribosome small subunit-dependent GTPase A [Planctomycetales bacterium]MCB0344878.1 ribosome small subunit-dependent GTPase A [Bdellovibrionales bacterium]
MPERVSDETKTARVVAASRRYVLLLHDAHTAEWAKTASRHLDLCVGDLVSYSSNNQELIVDSVLPRSNCLKRSYGRRSKELAANVDLLLVMTAPQPLFNTSFIDRILAAANTEAIDAALVVNKCDLTQDLQQTHNAISTYRNIASQTIELSAKTKTNLGELQNLLGDPQIRVAVFAGVSGVGKSSLINCLIPDAAQTVQDVSSRTGQGRQTTTQATGYIYRRDNMEDLCLIDMPGIQNFGLTHLEKAAVKNAFCDFTAVAQNCQFSNCMHLEEPQCAVKQAIESKDIAETRYQSYLEILDEIDRFVEY